MYYDHDEADVCSRSVKLEQVRVCCLVSLSLIPPLDFVMLTMKEACHNVILSQQGFSLLSSELFLCSEKKIPKCHLKDEGKKADIKRHSQSPSRLTDDLVKLGRPTRRPRGKIRFRVPTGMFLHCMGSPSYKKDNMSFVEENLEVLLLLLCSSTW